MSLLRPPPLSRRALLTAGAGLALGPLAGRRAALGQGAEVDVVIIGAGAAGIAAARRIAEAGRTYALVEASSRVGGRAVTDLSRFGVPFDLGADRLHLPAAAPLAALMTAAGAQLGPTPTGARLYLHGREASDLDYEDFISTVRRTERPIIAAGDVGRDLAAARVIDVDGRFAASARFIAGPFTCARDLDQVSTVDFSRAEERDGALVAPLGIGAALARLAAPLTVRLDTVVRSIELDARPVVVRSSRGTLQGRFVILAVPPSVITAGLLRILPTLPVRYRTALERIPLGAYDHLAFELPANPLGLRPDETVHFQADGTRACALVARIGGSDLYTLEVGGNFARELADAPPEAARAFIGETLTREFGAEAARKVGRWHATRWTKEPYALGAFSCALPGAGNLRRAFTEVVAGRLLFAGEHAHETAWGTVAGAWLSGERAARQVLTGLSGGRTG